MNKITKVIEAASAAAVIENGITQNDNMKKLENQIFEEHNKHSVYEANIKLKNKIKKIYIKDYKKDLIKNSKLTFVFNVITIVIFVALIISSVSCFIFLNDPLDKWMIPILIWFCGGGMDFLSYFTYKILLINKATDRICYRDREKIVFNNDGFDYFYFDDVIAMAGQTYMLKYSIIYKDIDYVEYDSRVGEFKIFSGIKSYTYNLENKCEDLGEWAFFSLQNIYQIDLIKIMKENNVLVKEKDYRIQREESKKAVLECKNEK